MAASGFDMCLLVHEWIIDGINKFVMSGKENGRKPKTFEFCTYCLAVHYLDNLDFGARVVEHSIPRVLVWKGNLVKYFSELDRKRKNVYGTRQFKKDFARTFKEDLCSTKADILKCNIHLRPASQLFKENMNAKFSKTLPAHIIDGIINITHSGNHDQSGTCKDTEAIAHDVLRFLSAANTSASKSNVQTQNVAKCGVHAPNNVIDKLIPPKNDGKINSSKSETTLKDEIYWSPPRFTRASTSRLFYNQNSRSTNWKVKQRVCNRTQHDQELALLNTHPADVKDRGSFFKYDIENDKIFSSSTIFAKDVKLGTGAVIIPFHANQNSHTMMNNMSPIGKINLAQHFSGKEWAVNPRLQLIELGDNEVLKAKGAVGSQQAAIPVCDDSPKPQLLDLRHPSSQIISPLSLAARQSELAKNTDTLYNGMLPSALKQEHLPGPNLGNDDAANSEANDALIIIRPKQILKLPIKPNKSFPVTEQDVKHYNAIIEVAYTKSLQKRYALIYPRVHCNYVSLGQSLMPGGHIDTFLVPCFCRRLFEESHPSRSGRHHFSHTLEYEYILNYKNTEKLKTIATSFLGAASASRKKRLDLSVKWSDPSPDPAQAGATCTGLPLFLFFPLCQGGHWIVFAVDFQYGLFAFMNSLYDKDSHFHTTIREQLIENFIKLWELIFKTQEHNFRTFKRMYPHVPHQENTDDCGVFGMKIMEIWNPLIDLRKVFSAAYITHIRIQYMIQLYFWGKNTADKSLINDFQLEGVFIDNES